jgi:hypothetical protein
MAGFEPKRTLLRQMSSVIEMALFIHGVKRVERAAGVLRIKASPNPASSTPQQLTAWQAEIHRIADDVNKDLTDFVHANIANTKKTNRNTKLGLPNMLKLLNKIPRASWLVTRASAAMCVDETAPSNLWRGVDNKHLLTHLRDCAL